MKMSLFGSGGLKIILTDSEKNNYINDITEIEKSGRSPSAEGLNKLIEMAEDGLGYRYMPEDTRVSFFTGADGMTVYVYRVPNAGHTPENDGFYTVENENTLKTLTGRMNDPHGSWKYTVLHGEYGYAIRFEGKEPVFAPEFAKRLDSETYLAVREHFLPVTG